MTYVSTCLADGAVGLYQMAESSSASAVVDEKGNQNGTYGNTAGITVGQTGIPGGGGVTATRFVKASAGFMQVVDNAAQHVGDTFTLEIWVKLASTGIVHGLLDGGAGSTPYMRINANGTVEVIKSGVASIETSTGTITDTTTFHQLGWTKATTTNHIYIDGATSDGTVTNAACINSVAWFVGASEGGCDVTAAMAAIYPTALTPTQMANHFTIGSAAVTYVPQIVAHTQGGRW
jgi:Concanavalin A-like lectin/glucanases superfamily